MGVGALQVAGDAGIGKTRLVGALASRARAKGQVVLEGRTEATGTALPLGVFCDALRGGRRSGVVGGSPSDPLAARFIGLLLPELGLVERTAEGDRGELFECASAFVRFVAADRGLLLVLEDLHWADSTSLSLVHHLARAFAGEPVLILATYRTDEASAHGALGVLRGQLARDRLGQETLLAPLDVSGVKGMLTAILGLTPQIETVRAIFTASEGNPFAVEEITHHVIGNGRLDPDSGAWVAGVADTGLPWTLQELVLERVRRLSDAEHELLRWAAIIGVRVDLRLVAAVAGRGETETLRSLAALCAAGLMTEETLDEAGLRFSFRHALTRDAVLETLLVAERRRRHQRVLGLAEELYGSDPDAPLEELAAHAIGAGDRRRAFTYASLAARRALELAGYPEAEDLYARALELWEQADGLAARAALLLGHGRLLARLSRDPRAAPLLTEARDAYLALGERVAAIQALAAAAGARWNGGERIGLLHELERAAGDLTVHDPPEARLAVSTVLARAHLMAGHPNTARRVATSALDAVPSHPTISQRRADVHLRTTLGSATWLLGEADEGDKTLFEALWLARQGGDELGVLRALSDLSYWHLNRDEPSASGLAEDGLALARERGVRLPVAWLAAARALIHLKSGDWRSAIPLLAEADGARADLGPDPELRLSHDWARGEWCLVAEDPPAAVAVLGPAAAEADGLGDLQLASRLRRSLARAHLARDDVAAASAALGPLLRRWRAAADGPLPVPVRVIVTASELCAAGGLSQESRELQVDLEGRPPHPRVRYARAMLRLAAGAPGESSELCESCDEVEGSGWRFEAARMRLCAAAALSRDGRTTEAGPLLARAHQDFLDLDLMRWCERAETLMRHLGVAPAPSRARGDLSAREIEVLELVCAGASNRQIAEHLVISPKTAARHVANIFVKLGAHSRVQAAGIATDRGLVRRRESA